MATRRSSGAAASVNQIVNELAADFESMPKARIEELVKGSFGELSDGARIKTYLPILTKRVAKERLRRSA